MTMTMDGSELVNAIIDQDFDKLKRVLASGKIPINEECPGKDPPIIECVRPRYKSGSTDDEDDAKRCEILKLLVQHGADLNARSTMSWYRETAVMFAAERGFPKCLRFLVESGADITATTQYGHTAMMTAVIGRQVDSVKYLTEHMSVSLLNLRNGSGNTALMKAASYGDDRSIKSLQHLIAAGADLDVEDADGNTALMLALQHRSAETVELLLQKGARVNAVSHSGETPLLVALGDDYYNYKDIPKLLSHGLDPTLSRRNRLCLHIAVARGQIDIVRALVESGFPPLDLDCRNSKSYKLSSTAYLHSPEPISPLVVAILSTKPDIAMYLIANRFFTRYDIARLCWDEKIRQFLQETNENDISSSRSRPFQCLTVLDFLASNPRPLSTLCLVSISSRLSHDLALDYPTTPQGKDIWVCNPTFLEKVKVLQLPPSMKRSLLHQNYPPAPLVTRSLFPWQSSNWIKDYSHII
ncbi:hypothetical protein RRG08_037557 [Elysia crispata]|uniref:Ankyrin repeat protein n=1 Tax=Elysia crispata TaxID=231223 RepID=A0AAE0Y5Y7_9GAST|nr:hypothetical protein RRG08_037557 [Elysia crispata]